MGASGEALLGVFYVVEIAKFTCFVSLGKLNGFFFACSKPDANYYKYADG